MNDTTSPKHPPLPPNQDHPGAPPAQCGDHAECFERLREEAMENADKWIGILKDMSDILEVRIAAVCAGVDVTVIGEAQS